MKIDNELQTEFRNAYQKTRLNLHFTHNFLSYKVQEMFKCFGLSPSQFNVLRILRGQYPGTASIGLIKERMLDKSSDVSRIVDRMILKQLLERKECPLDRRQKDIKITPKGLDLLSKMDESENLLDEQLKHLSEKELEQLNFLLDKIRSKNKAL